MTIEQVTVFCASSRQVHARYLEAARVLGRELATHGITVVYGAGSVGLMGELARGALEKNGRVVGVIPRFMLELKWGHSGISETRVVDDLRARKAALLEGSDAMIALPGGTGTLDELLETITLKRLCLFLKPIVIVNVQGFFDPLLQMLDRCIEERFMDPRHRSLWSVVERPEDALLAIAQAPHWDASAIAFASV